MTARPVGLVGSVFVLGCRRVELGLGDCAERCGTAQGNLKNVTNGSNGSMGQKDGNFVF